MNVLKFFEKKNKFHNNKHLLPVKTDFGFICINVQRTIFLGDYFMIDNIQANYPPFLFKKKSSNNNEVIRWDIIYTEYPVIKE